MALIHRAQLRPTKLELLEEWLPSREWAGDGGGSGLERVAAYRFDDPAGEVGVETLLVRAGDGPVLQVPLTYRGAPLDGGDSWLVGTCEHSVLGRRWVYDAVGDPVYAAALVKAILGGGGQAQEFFETDGRLEPRPLSMTIVVDEGEKAGESETAPGDPALVVAEGAEFAVVRRVGGGWARDGLRLSGSWSGQPALVPLVFVANVE
ncbi:CG0192-related protein [Actinoplanes sp. CA-131856]